MVKRGRLAKEDGRKAKYLLRMSKEEQETLDYIHRKTGKSKFGQKVGDLLYITRRITVYHKGYFCISKRKKIYKNCLLFGQKSRQTLF